MKFWEFLYASIYTFVLWQFRGHEHGHGFSIAAVAGGCVVALLPFATRRGAAWIAPQIQNIISGGEQMLLMAIVFSATKTGQARRIRPMLIQCLPAVADDGPKLKQHRTNAPRPLGQTGREVGVRPSHLGRPAWI